MKKIEKIKNLEVALGAIYAKPFLSADDEEVAHNKARKILQEIEGLRVQKIARAGNGFGISEEGVFVHAKAISKYGRTRFIPGMLVSIEETRETPKGVEAVYASLIAINNGGNGCNTGSSHIALRREGKNWALCPVVRHTDSGYEPDRVTVQEIRPGDIVLTCRFGHGEPHNWELPEIEDVDESTELKPGNCMDAVSATKWMEETHPELAKQLLNHLGRRANRLPVEW
jgi:cold shock CspA family protein